jgi:RNA polymerase sigma factor (sigma-70 family)
LIPARGVNRPVTRWERTLTDLVQARGQALKRYAFLLTGDDTAAEDLVQDALLRVFARHRRRHVPDALEAYLRTAILNRHLDQARRHQRWLRLLPLLAAPTRQPSHDAAVLDRHDALGALARLSPRQRACVVLRYYEDLTLAQIAQRLGVTQGAVKRHLADATRRLTPELLPADDGGEND